MSNMAIPMDMLVASILFAMASVALYISYKVGNIVITMGKRDKLYDRFKRGTNKLGMEINVEYILGARLMATIIISITGIGLLASKSSAAFVVLILALAVYFYPVKWLSSIEKKRMAEIKKEFPLMVSLLKVYAKAGGLYNSLRIVRNALDGELKRQMDILVLELEIYPLKAAMDNLANRVKYPPLNNLVSVVIMGINTGANIDEILEGFAKSAYEGRVNELKRKIKAQPIIMTVIPAILMFTMLLMIVYPMFSNIITRLNQF